MYNLTVYDYSTKYTFIYNFKPVKEDELNTILDYILLEMKRYMNDEEIHLSFLDNNECIIYKYKENVRKGWIWNSSVYDKEILYKIRPIMCIDIENDNHKDIQNKECQTEILNTNTSSTNDYTHKIIDDIPLELNPISITINKKSNDINWGELSWNDDFKYELKNKLNLENFGLYDSSKHFKQD